MLRYQIDPAMVHENASRQAVFTASIAAAVMTVSAVASGVLRAGQPIVGVDIAAGSRITALNGTGVGGTGTYGVTSQTAGSQTMKSGLVQLPIVNGAGGVYWNFGPNCRVVYTTTASYGRVRLNSTAAPNPYGQRTYPTEIPYRVNGKDYRAGVAQLGDDWYEFVLPGDGVKTLEMFAPIQNALIFGNQPVGGYPIELELNAPATAVAPSTTNAHMVIWGDSIAVGGYASSMVLRGYAGTLKRGQSDKYLPATSPLGQPRYKGAYNPATAYAVDDVFLYTDNRTWRVKIAQPAGTVPTVGASFEMRGFDGRVTLEAYGSRRIFDDLSTAANVTAFVAHLAALTGTTAGSRWVMAMGSNDWASGFANAAALQAAVLDFLNKLAGSTIAALPLTIITPLLTTSRETAGRSDMSLPNIRAAIVAAVAANAAGATPKSGITVIDGATVITTADLVDGLHLTDGGHAKIRNAIA